jgi:acylphosphatase
MERVRVIVHGRVQGVFFRANTIKEARRLGLSGFVRNRPDGTVEAAAEGEREPLERFVEWCRRGPPMSRVDRLDVTWEEPGGEFEGFGLA